MIELLLAGIVAVSPAHQAPKPHVDRVDFALLAADAGIRALDVYSTCRALNQGDHEMFLPGFVANHTPVLIGVEAGAVAADYLVARYMVKHHHPKLAKVALMVDFAQDAPWAIHNLYLQPEQTKPGWHRVGK